MNIDELLEGMVLQRQTVAVAAAEDDAVLQAVCAAHERGIATPILCGDRAKIEAIAAAEALDISTFEIRAAANPLESARAAVALVRQGHADMLMKGRLQTADLLRAVLDRETGLRGQGILSHVGILVSPVLNRRLLVTDGAMVPYPDLQQKAAILGNAVAAARRLGIERPMVAALAAVEVVNPQMQATVDAALLAAMNRRGQIADCLVDGPLALDLAISPEAARHKGIDSEVAGQADILLFPAIEAANSTVKAFTIGGGCLFGGVIVGAAAPIVLTSRSDSGQSKLYSIACAAAISR